MNFSKNSTPAASGFSPATGASGVMAALASDAVARKMDVAFRIMGRVRWLQINSTERLFLDGGFSRGWRIKMMPCSEGEKVCEWRETPAAGFNAQRPTPKDGMTNDE